MGTNFYTINRTALNGDDLDAYEGALYGTHIGKRSADGVWCWRCKVRANVLREDGSEVNAAEHSRAFMGGFGRASPYPPRAAAWVCPACRSQTTKTEMDDTYNATSVELGFQKPAVALPDKRPVRSASHWTWQTGPHGLADTVDAVQGALERYTVVYDEYGGAYDQVAFTEVLRFCLNESEEPREFS
jgi:Zn finger protein HypA/HybF involved in hydrogenase expression